MILYDQGKKLPKVTTEDIIECKNINLKSAVDTLNIQFTKNFTKQCLPKRIRKGVVLYHFKLTFGQSC